MNRSLGRQCFLVFIVTVFENFSHRNTRLLHVRDSNSPVVVSTTECNSSIHNADLPALLEFFRSKLSDESVHFLDGFSKTGHHVFGSNLQFVNQTVDLVNEKNRLHLFFERLTNNRLRLGHWSFNCTSENKTSIDCTHGTSNVSTEVNVTGCINEVDEVVRSFNSVNH